MVLLILVIGVLWWIRRERAAKETAMLFAMEELNQGGAVMEMMDNPAANANRAGYLEVVQRPAFLVNGAVTVHAGGGNTAVAGGNQQQFIIPMEGGAGAGATDDVDYLVAVTRNADYDYGPPIPPPTPRGPAAVGWGGTGNADNTGEADCSEVYDEADGGRPPKDEEGYVVDGFDSGGGGGGADLDYHDNADMFAGHGGGGAGARGGAGGGATVYAVPFEDEYSVFRDVPAQGCGGGAATEGDYWYSEPATQQLHSHGAVDATGADGYVSDGYPGHAGVDGGGGGGGTTTVYAQIAEVAGGGGGAVYSVPFEDSADATYSSA
jgi:hypothetical protein